MITYKIHLIRTGSTADGNVTRYVGQADIPLSGAGREKLINLRESCSYPKVGSVYTSPLLRCVQTADILYPDTYTVQTEEITDLCLGEFEGKTLDELKDIPAFTSWMADSYRNTPPGGEEITAFVNRLAAAVNSIFMDMMEERITDTALITHRGVIAALLSAIGLPRHPVYEWLAENGKGFTLLMTPQMWMQGGCAEIFGIVPKVPE